MGDNMAEHGGNDKHEAPKLHYSQIVASKCATQQQGANGCCLLSRNRQGYRQWCNVSRLWCGSQAAAGGGSSLMNLFILSTMRGGQRRTTRSHSGS